jgi:hypothetical protein
MPVPIEEAQFKPPPARHRGGVTHPMPSLQRSAR